MSRTGSHRGPFVLTTYICFPVDVVNNLKKSTFLFDLSFNNKQSYALAELLQTPMITIQTIRNSIRNEYVFSLRPSEETLARSTVDIVQYFMEHNAQIAILADGKLIDTNSR